MCMWCMCVCVERGMNWRERGARGNEYIVCACGGKNE